MTKYLEKVKDQLLILLELVDYEKLVNDYADELEGTLECTEEFNLFIAEEKHTLEASFRISYNKEKEDVVRDVTLLDGTICFFEGDLLGEKVVELKIDNSNNMVNFQDIF